MKNYYDLFGIAPDADREAIKQAYRRLARLYHPDARPNDPAAAEQFKQINDIYQTLINVERRARYDTELRHQQTKPDPSTTSPSPVATHMPTYDPSVARAKVLYATEKPENTNAFVLYMFIGVLITLTIIMCQGLLLAFNDSDDSTQRRAPNPSAQRAGFVVTPSSIPAGPATFRQPAATIDERLLLDAAASCRVNVRGGQSSCDGIDAIVFAQPLTDEQAVMQVNMATYSRMILRIEYDGEPNNWTLNVGGSPRNNGTNDISENENDAQLSLFGHDLLIYSNAQNDHSQLARISDIAQSNGILTLDIQHQQVAWHTSTTDEVLVSRHWLTLHDDAAMLYIGLNRAIVEPTTRTGHGLAYLTIWLLP